jgi:FMN reductase [NAD(P)H]
MDIIELLQKQTTTRKDEFSEEIIKTEIIEEIKSSIVQTANASNRQSYSIIIVDREKANLLNLPGDKVFLFCIDFYRLHLCAQELEKELDSEYLMQFVTALIDISLLAQSTIIVSQSLGLSTRITNEIYHNKLEIIFESLGLPENYVFPLFAVSLGYSKKNRKKQKGRISSKYLFHSDQYQKVENNDINEIIKEYDSIEKNIALVNNWKDKGFNHYLEWFFDKWSPNIGSRKQSEAFVKALKKHRII